MEGNSLPAPVVYDSGSGLKGLGRGWWGLGGREEEERELFMGGGVG